MAFNIVNRISNDPPLWCAGDGSSTYYVGQLVSIVAAAAAAVSGAVAPLAVPAGVADTTNKQIIFGVVVGVNNRTPVSDPSLGEYGSSVTTQATQLGRLWLGQEGMYSKGDPQLLLQVERIFPTTVLHGNIYNGAIGVAPTVVKDTAGTDTTGYTTAGTTGTADFTPVAKLGSIYCRSGVNAGLYRTTIDVSATGPQVKVAFPYDVALNDQFVRVPMKQGQSQIYIGGPGLYIDCSNNGATNNFGVFVTRLGLENAGQEYAEFSFNVDHFCVARA